MILQEKLHEITKLIEEKGGVLFGSRAWGGHNETSIYDSDYYVYGFYVTINNEDLPFIQVKFNITGCKKSDFDAWKIANEMMKSIPKESLSITHKPFRQLLFETNLAILKKIHSY